MAKLQQCDTKTLGVKAGVCRLSAPLTAFKTIRCYRSFGGANYTTFATVTVPAEAVIVSHENNDDLRTNAIHISKIPKFDKNDKCYNYYYGDNYRIVSNAVETEYKEHESYTTVLNYDYAGNPCKRGFHFMTDTDKLVKERYYSDYAKYWSRD